MAAASPLTRWWSSAWRGSPTSQCDTWRGSKAAKSRRRFRPGGATLPCPRTCSSVTARRACSTSAMPKSSCRLPPMPRHLCAIVAATCRRSTKTVSPVSGCRPNNWPWRARPKSCRRNFATTSVANSGCWRKRVASCERFPSFPARSWARSIVICSCVAGVSRQPVPNAWPRSSSCCASF